MQYQGKTSFLHGREFFAYSGYGTAPGPTVPALSRNNVPRDGCKSVIIFIFKHFHWNLTHWK